MLDKTQEQTILSLFNRLCGEVSTALHQLKDHPNFGQLVDIGIPAGVYVSWYCGKSDEELTKSKIAHQIIKAIGIKMVEPLISQLQHENTEVQVGAIFALLEFKNDDRIVEPLISCLSNPSPKVRASAARILQFTKSNKATDPIISLLQDESEIVRATAAQTLLWLDGDSKIGPLLARLTDPDENLQVRINAAHTLAATKDLKLVDPLINLLSHEHGELRGAAAIALSKIGDQRAVSHIRPLLQDKSKKVRKDVKFALANFDQARR